MPARFWPVPCWVFLSTPSARRATYELGFTDVDAIEISIHALREEGDLFCEIPNVTLTYFYPRPPRGGRHSRNALRPRIMIFLSTPSARRATVHPARSTGSISNFYPRPPRGGRRNLSAGVGGAGNFYPRPPRGGRRQRRHERGHQTVFLSTPSARRATLLRDCVDIRLVDFYPRPPRGGRHDADGDTLTVVEISIHALREEGDSKNRDKISIFKQIIQHSARI